MNKRTLLLLFFFSLLFCTQGVQGQTWLWARQGKNHKLPNVAYASAMDSYHNAYLTGAFNGDTLIFNNDTLIAPNSIYVEAFLVKYDENGNLLWARGSQTSENGWVVSMSAATDKQNNVYITGQFTDTAYFQSHMVEQAPTNHYINNNIFIVKYDENGNVIWAKQSTHNTFGNAAGQSIATDKHGNIYVAGYFQDTIHFGIYTLRSNMYGNENFFLVKYNPAGNVLWAKQAVNDNSMNIISGVLGSNCIAVDASGHEYVTGYFSDTVYFGSQMLHSSGGFSDAFLVKYDSNGNVIWARQSTHTGTTSYAEGYGICTDKEDNIYTIGILNDTINFGATSLIGRNQYYTIYWTKYDSAGNIIWAKQSYNLDSLTYWSWAIKTDASENLYITGVRGAVNYSNAEVVFDSDTLQVNHTGDPFFFIKMDSLGTVLNGYIFSQSPNEIEPQPLAVDSSGCYVYYVGNVDTTVVLGNDTLGANVSQGLVVYPFIARWSDGECTTGINNTKGQQQGISIYPNPVNKLLTINLIGQLHGPATLSVMDVAGRKVLSCKKSISNDVMQVNVCSLASGMYFINLKTKNIILTKKFIKQ